MKELILRTQIASTVALVATLLAAAGILVLLFLFR